MIYYNDGKILIRDMSEGDGRIFCDGEKAQGWNSDISKFEMRILHQKEKKSVSLTAEYCGEPAGYIHIYPYDAGGPFKGSGYPEIVDFNVLEKYRRNGIGGSLMDAAERIAAGFSHTVCIGVGLHSGYGSAQRMYVKRGYIPDGSGVWYRDAVCEQYAPCCNDDELVLYMSKKL